MREMLGMLCINLVSMPYVGGNEYNLIESNKVKTKFVHGQGWKDACYQILSFELWRNLVTYNTRFLSVKKFTLKLFWRAIYSTIKGRITCWRKYKYVEVKDENIEIFQKINEGLIIEEEPKINIVETIKKETIEEVVNDLNEVKLHDCNIQAPIILVGGTETKYIDFIGVEIFDLIIDSYLVNIFNCMKIKGQEIQVAQLMTFK